MVPALVIAALQEASEDPDPFVAGAALEALAHACVGLPTQDPLAADLLRRALSATLASANELRRAALQALKIRVCANRESAALPELAVLKALLVGLSDPCPEAARASAEALGPLALGSTPAEQLLAAALLTGLRGSAWELRPTCAYLLGPHATDPRVAAALRRALTDPDPSVASAAAAAHLPCERAADDEQAREALLQALCDPHPSVRVAAAGALAPARGHRAVHEALLRGMGDIYGRMRLTCAAALCDLCATDPSVRAALRAALEDSYWPLRDLCATALSEGGLSGATTQALGWGATSDSGRLARGALTDSGRRSRSSLNDSGRLSRSNPPGAPRAAAVEDRFLPSARRVPPSQLAIGQLCQGLLHPDPDVRLCCAHWLGARATEPAARAALCDALLGRRESPLDRLLPGWMLSPPSGHARAACALSLGALAAAAPPALGELSDPGLPLGGRGEAALAVVDGLAARRALLEDLSDSHGEVREACALALQGSASHPAVREALCAALRDGDAALQRACAVALQGQLSTDAAARGAALDAQLQRAVAELVEEQRRTREHQAAELARTRATPAAHLLAQLADRALPARLRAASALALVAALPGARLDRESRSGSAVADRESRSGSAVADRESRSGSAVADRCADPPTQPPR